MIGASGPPKLGGWEVGYASAFVDLHDVPSTLTYPLLKFSPSVSFQVVDQARGIEWEASHVRGYL